MVKSKILKPSSEGFFFIQISPVGVPHGMSPTGACWDVFFKVRPHGVRFPDGGGVRI